MYLVHTFYHIWILATYDIVCHLRYRMPGCTSDIVCRVLDVVYHIVYAISYIRYCFVGHTISYVRYRMFLGYRMSTCDVVCTTYDIVLHNESITYTISYVCKYMRYRMSVMYDIVCAYRIQYRMSYTISYVDIRYRI